MIDGRRSTHYCLTYGYKWPNMTLIDYLSTQASQSSLTGPPILCSYRRWSFHETHALSVSSKEITSKSTRKRFTAPKGGKRFFGLRQHKSSRRVIWRKKFEDCLPWELGKTEKFQDENMMNDNYIITSYQDNQSNVLSVSSALGMNRSLDRVQLLTVTLAIY